MSTTPRTKLPLLAAAQAQKHVTHNDALVLADALIAPRILDRDLATPPVSPSDGDAYLVRATASGAWSGQEGKIAYCIDGGWRFAAPFAGLTLYVADENVLLLHTGSGFIDVTSLVSFQNLAMIGINATADTTNKLAVKSSAVLFDNIGAGVQFKINKHAAGDTASLLYQTNYAGRAEIGLTGDDHFHFKVSPDGSSWTEALKLDKSSGLATLAGNPTASFHAATKQYVDSAAAALQPLDSDLTAIAALTPSNDDIVQRKSGAWTNRSIAQLGADLAAANTGGAWGDPVASWSWSSNVSNVDFTGLSGYRELWVVAYGLLHNSGTTQNFLLRVSTDNGSTFSSAGYLNYGNGNVSDSVQVSASAASTTFGFDVKIVDFNLSARRTLFAITQYQLNATSGARPSLGIRDVAEADNALRLAVSGGQISAGTLLIYGRK
jgi:hypothetical protein